MTAVGLGPYRPFHTCCWHVLEHQNVIWLIFRETSNRLILLRRHVSIDEQNLLLLLSRGTSDVRFLVSVRTFC